MVAMVTTQCDQWGILIGRVGNVVGDAGAIGVTLALGVPNKAHGFGGHHFEQWQWRQITTVYLCPECF